MQEIETFWCNEEKVPYPSFRSAEDVLLDVIDNLTSEEFESDKEVSIHEYKTIPTGKVKTVKAKTWYQDWLEGGV